MGKKYYILCHLSDEVIKASIAEDPESPSSYVRKMWVSEIAIDGGEAVVAAWSSSKEDRLYVTCRYLAKSVASGLKCRESYDAKLGCVPTYSKVRILSK